MKKLILICSTALFLGACGSGGGTVDNNNDSLQPVSPRLKEIHKTSNDLNVKAKDLNQKADSILNNI